MDECVFCKIAKGEIPRKKIYENDNFFSVPDISTLIEVSFGLYQIMLCTASPRPSNLRMGLVGCEKGDVVSVCEKGDVVSG